MLHPNPGSILAGILFAMVTPVAAQTTYGNAAAVNATSLLEVSPAGAVTTIAAMPGNHTPLGICASIDNRGVAVLTRVSTSSSITFHVIEVKNGVLRTIGQAQGPGNPTFPMSQGGLVQDQRGDYIAGTSSGILRFSGVGGTVSTIQTSAATGICEHLAPGGWLSFFGNSVFRITRNGKRSKVAGMTGPVPVGIGSIAADTTTGNAFATSGALFAVDVNLGTFTTLARSGTIGAIQAVDIDPVSRNLVVGTSSGVYRLDRKGAVLHTFATIPRGVIGLAVIGSGHTAGFGPASPGTTYNLVVTYPGHPGHFHALAASFGFSPGIPIPQGVIPLNPDDLFYLSRLAPQIFKNFSGQLDATGRAAATLAIPNVPIIGVRIFLAGLAFDGKGAVKVISEPMGLTFE